MQRATVQWRLPPEYLDPAAGLGPYTCYFLHVQPPSKSSILVQLTSWLLGSSTLFACRQRYASSPTPKTGAPAADAIRSRLKRGKQQSRGRGAHQAVLAASAAAVHGQWLECRRRRRGFWSTNRRQARTKEAVEENERDKERTSQNETDEKRKRRYGSNREKQETDHKRANWSEVPLLCYLKGRPRPSNHFMPFGIHVGQQQSFACWPWW